MEKETTISLYSKGTHVDSYSNIDKIVVNNKDGSMVGISIDRLMDAVALYLYTHEEG